MKKLETSQMIALVGALLVVCGLFLPWVAWEAYFSDVPAGYAIGLEIVDGWILLFFALFAGYFSFQEPGGLNSLLVLIFGSFIFFGASLDMGVLPQGLAPSKLYWAHVVHPAAGLYMGQAGGLLVLLYGIFTIIRLPIPPSISKPAEKITRKVVTGAAIALVAVTVVAGIYFVATALPPDYIVLVGGLLLLACGIFSLIRIPTFRK